MMPLVLPWLGLLLLGLAVGAFGTLIGAGGGFLLVPLTPDHLGLLGQQRQHLRTKQLIQRLAVHHAPDQAKAPWLSLDFGASGGPHSQKQLGSVCWSAADCSWGRPLPLPAASYGAR